MKRTINETLLNIFNETHNNKYLIPIKELKIELFRENPEKLSRIAIIGTHGAGKSTLSMKLGAYFRSKLINAIVLHETARECPFPLNDGMTVATMLWIYHRQIMKEIEARDKFGLVISDRSSIDSFLYGIDKGFYLNYKYIKSQLLAALEWLYSYDIIYLVKQSEFQPAEDGIRDTRVEFQKKIQDLFMDFYELYEGILPIQIIHSGSIFKKNDICKILFGD